MGVKIPNRSSDRFIDRSCVRLSLGGLRHLANTHVHMNVRLCWQSNQAIVDRPSLATVGWRCRNGGPVRSVYISWLNSPTIKTLSTVGQPTVDMMLRLDEPSKPRD